MGYEYDAAIAVTRTGDGVFDADLEAGWMVGGGINGGYLQSVVGNAIRSFLEGSGHPDPYTISSYFISPSRPGPATVRVGLIRTGRGTSTVSAGIWQEQDGVEVQRISALATYGDLGALPAGPEHLADTPPQLPPVEECVLTSDSPEDWKKFVPMLDRFQMRLDPATAGAFVGAPGGNNFIQGWFKLVDDRPIDPIALLTVVDTLPPVTFELGIPGWAPTLELTAHVRGTPAPGWLRIRHETKNFTGGFFEEDCVVWDGAGRLVAQSRQLALQPRPM